MEFETVLYERRGHIAYVTLNRPEKLNAINSQLVADHKAALLAANDDLDVRVVVVQGAGRAFSSGHDITPVPGRSMHASTIADGLRGMHQRMTDCRVAIDINIPVIGQIHGYCLAGAIDIIMYYDINIAAEDAVFAHPPVRIMGTPDNPRWTYLLGPQRASYMVLTGRQIDGRTAAAWGWVFQAVPASDLGERVRELAEDIAKVPRDVLMLNKKQVTNWFWASGGGIMFHTSAFIAGMAGKVSNETPEGRLFWSTREEEGHKAAVEYRDRPFHDFRGSR
jgi:enoyl-CoA hydratase